MSEKIKLNKAQSEFIRMMTGEKDTQEAVDAILELMTKEELPRKYFLKLVVLCMDKYPNRKK